MRRPPVRCLAGTYPLPEGRGYQFSVVNTPEHGWFIWEGKTIPDHFKKGEGHVYEILWEDERLEFRLIEENFALKIRVRFPIWPVDSYILTAGAERFYSLRDAIRELGKEVTRTDWEQDAIRKFPRGTII